MLIYRKIPLSYIFSLIQRESILVVLLAGIISATDEYYADWFGVQYPIMPMSIPSTLGTIITLVLAFKMSQSYDRWWEARKIWGAITNHSRTLIREVSFLRTMESDSIELKLFSKKVIRLLLAWLYEMVISLRKLEISDLSHDYLTPDEEKELSSIDDNKPNAILFLMQKELRKVYKSGLLTDYQEIKISSSIACLTDDMGMAQRIATTVFPMLYTRMIDFATWSFVILLPLAFRDPNKWVEFPVVLLLAFIFFMLEHIACDLQDPFENKPTDIPILSIARNIEIHGLKIMGEKDIPEKIQPVDFYLM